VRSGGKKALSEAWKRQITGMAGLEMAFTCVSQVTALIPDRIGRLNRSLVQVVTPHRNKLCGRPPQYAPAPCKLTVDLLTLKVVSESRVTWATSVPILVLGLSVLDLGPTYATDRRQTRVIA